MIWLWSTGTTHRSRQHRYVQLHSESTLHRGAEIHESCQIVDTATIRSWEDPTLPPSHFGSVEYLCLLRAPLPPPPYCAPCLRQCQRDFGAKLKNSPFQTASAFRPSHLLSELFNNFEHLDPGEATRAIKPRSQKEQDTQVTTSTSHEGMQKSRQCVYHAKMDNIWGLGWQLIDRSISIWNYMTGP